MTEREYETVVARTQVDMIRSILTSFDPPGSMISQTDILRMLATLESWRNALYRHALVKP